MGCSRNYGSRTESLFFDSLVAHRCGCNAGLLACTDGETARTRVQGQLLRADNRSSKWAAAFCRDRPGRHHSFCVSVSTVCASARLGD